VGQRATKFCTAIKLDDRKITGRPRPKILVTQMPTSDLSAVDNEEEEEFIYHKYTYTSNFRLIHVSDGLPEKQ